MGVWFGPFNCSSCGHLNDDETESAALPWTCPANTVHPKIWERLEKLVNLRLASTSDDRALAIRDHLLPIVRECGTLQKQCGPVRLITVEMGDWVFSHWTPFNELSAAEASSPGYRHAIQRQHTRPDLPYGLEVWRGGKLLSVLWADDGPFEVVNFVRGPWEDEALKLRKCDSGQADQLK